MENKVSPFIALRYRNFRLLWLGQLISMSGSMMQTAAILWHISLLAPPAQRGLALGLVGLARIVPVLVFSMLSGVLADALDRRKLMLITQGGMTLVAVALAGVALAGLHTVWMVYVLAALSSAFGSFDNPARQALIPSLVPREHLPNAISLNSTMFQFAGVAGPALGGLVIASLGVGWAYAFNAVSFLFVIGSLLLMRDLPPVLGERSAISLNSALDGLRFVFSQPLIRGSMVLDFFATFFGSAMFLLPIFAQDVLFSNERGYGLLVAAPAAGSLITSLLMVSWAGRIQRRGWTMLAAVALYGLATVIFGLSRSFWLTFACLALTGVADTISMIIRQVIRQLATPDAMRGRMTGVNMLFFMGGPELGEMEAGLLANWFGAPFSVISGGLGCLLATAGVAWLTPELRAYRRDPLVLAAEAAD